MTIQDVINSLKAIVLSDVAKTALPQLATFFSSIAANPTAINFTVQEALLQVQLLGDAPGIGQDLLKGLSTNVQALAAELAAKATAEAATLATPAAAAPTVNPAPAPVQPTATLASGVFSAAEALAKRAPLA